MKNHFASLNVSRYTVVTLILIAVKIALHLLTNTNYELHRDELLYFNMAGHLNAGYATVPPMTAFIAFIAKSLFGYSVFGLRLFPALTGGLAVLLIAKIVREMGGGIAALTIAALSYISSPGFLLLNTAFTPNTFEQILWLFATYIFMIMARQERPELWLIASVILGISFLFKYSVIFFIAGFFIAFLTSRYRKLLWSKYFYIAIFTGILIISPNIIWQYNHNWPVIRHMEELNRTQLNGMTTLYMMADLFSLTLAASFVWIFGLLALLLRADMNRYRFIGAASLAIIVLFAVLNGKGYYLMGILPFLFAVGGFALEKYLTGKLVFIRNGILVIVLAIALIALPTGLPLLSFEKYTGYREKTSFLKIYPFYRWEDGKVHELSQVYSDMTGWMELTRHAARAYFMLSPDERQKCTIYCERNYGYAGAINFYGKIYGLPDAVTFHESYTFWAPDSIPAGPLIFLNYDSDNLENLFSEIREVGYVSDRFFRESGVKVFLCRHPYPAVREVYRELALKEKSIYR